MMMTPRVPSSATRRSSRAVPRCGGGLPIPTGGSRSPRRARCHRTGRWSGQLRHRQYSGEFRIARRWPGAVGPRGCHDHDHGCLIGAVAGQGVPPSRSGPVHELGVLIIVTGLALRAGQAAEANPAIMKASAQFMADWPATTPMPGPPGTRASDIHHGRLARGQEPASTSGNRQDQKHAADFESPQIARRADRHVRARPRTKCWPLG